MLISELMVHELPGEAQMTRRLLTRITDDSLSWQPSSDLHTIGWNASHLVETMSWIPGIVTGAEWDIAPAGGEPMVLTEAKSSNELLQSFDTNVETAIAQSARCSRFSDEARLVVEDGRADYLHNEEERLHPQVDLQPFGSPSRHFIGLSAAGGSSVPFDLRRIMTCGSTSHSNA